MKLREGETLVIATHNKGKLKELQELLAPYGLTAISAGELSVSEPDETGKTFAENAALKALACAKATGKPSLADDSGLEVEALGGAPGVYSARWAGKERNFLIGMMRIEQELEAKGATQKEQRRARFVCALCLALADGQTHLFEGTAEGHLVWPPRGTHGFGYDPMFVPCGHDKTFGEMESAQKHALSHRTAAFAAFAAAVLDKR